MFFGLSLGLGGGVANAHPAANWYPTKWGPASLPIINWKFHTGFPTGAFRTRVLDGAGKWNAVQATAFTFTKLSTDNAQGYSVPANCASAPYMQEENVVYYRSIGAFGVTGTCMNSQGNIKYALVSFDSTGQNWYTGTGDPGAAQIDAHSVASHEFGHFTGFSGHFTTPDICPIVNPVNLDAWQTMCDGVVVLTPFADDLGVKFRRTLEAHDKHTFDGAY